MRVKLRSMTSLYLTRGDEMLLLYRVGSRVVEPSWCGIGGYDSRIYAGCALDIGTFFEVPEEF